MIMETKGKLDVLIASAYFVWKDIAIVRTTARVMLSEVQ